MGFGMMQKKGIKYKGGNRTLLPTMLNSRENRKTVSSGDFYDMLDFSKNELLERLALFTMWKPNKKKSPEDLELDCLSVSGNSQFHSYKETCLISAETEI